MGSAVQLRAIKRRRLRKRLIFSFAFVAFMSAIGAKPSYDHVRAASLLTRVAEPQSQSRLANFDRHPVRTEPVEMQSSLGTIPARLYIPADVTNAPALVIIHGVHGSVSTGHDSHRSRLHFQVPG